MSKSANALPRAARLNGGSGTGSPRGVGSSKARTLKGTGKRADKSGEDLGRGHVAEIQRSRMLTAMVQEISERGAANVSVAHVVGRSGVSRRTFYEIFDDREDCFLAAFDDALEHVVANVIPAYEQSGSWRVKMRAALTALLECVDYDPATGRLLIVESLAAGPQALERRQSVLAQIIPAIEEGQGESKTAADLPPLTAEGVAGGVLSVLHARLTEKNVEGSLLDLVNPLMGMIVLPYLGSAAVRKELERPTPKGSGKRPVVRIDPMQDLPMRFTYRTMRVLMAVAEQPGSSNRAVGETAGIGDQGQASKLLARLHKLGLIENQGGDPARGEPNAWTLTTTGTQVHDTITGLGG
jgi:AcrR family transcriptional regulator